MYFFSEGHNLPKPPICTYSVFDRVVSTRRRKRGACLQEYRKTISDFYYYSNISNFCATVSILPLEGSI